jgi:hypothetical protein
MGAVLSVLAGGTRGDAGAWAWMLQTKSDGNKTEE